MDSVANRSTDAAAPEPHGVVVWLTGRPSSGKTTLASAVHRELVRTGYNCVVLDGDAVRASIVPPHGYSAQGRAEFYATLTRLAAMLSSQGLIVLVAATAHRAAYRAEARERAGVFLEVFVDTTAEECERRDDKGLYAQARTGDISDLPRESFEVPARPDIVAHGGHDRAALKRVVDLVSRAAR